MGPLRSPPSRSPGKKLQVCVVPMGSLLCPWREAAGQESMCTGALQGGTGCSLFDCLVAEASLESGLTWGHKPGTRLQAPEKGLGFGSM